MRLCRSDSEIRVGSRRLFRKAIRDSDFFLLRSVAARATHFLPAQKVGKKALMGKAPSVIQNRLTHFAFPLRTPVVISAGSVSGKHGVPFLRF